MTNVVSEVTSFLRGKGLPDAAIAGILGNLQVESGFNTGASNAAEGAIGLAQWEGGRRANLQAYAAQHGLSETDLNAQLGYLWQELSGPYSHVLTQLQSAKDPGQAAALWDGQFEISSGQARGQRVTAAQQFAANGLRGGTDNGMVANATGLTSSAPATAAKMTAGSLASQSGLGAYLQVFNQVPELKQLMANAINSGQTAADFANAVQHSGWWQTHSDGFRKDYAQRVSDPATWTKEYQNQATTIMSIAGQMGVHLSWDQLDQLSKQSKMESWTADLLKNKIGDLWQKSSASASVQSGEAAQVTSQVSQIMSSYGLGDGGAVTKNYVWRILAGRDTVDGAKAYAQNYAKSAYPGLAAQIDQGLTVEDVAQPYKQSMAQILEVNPNTLTTTDPLIRRALQGTADSKGVRSSVPVYQFEDQLRSDPRWQRTDNAKQTYASALSSIGHDFGFGV